ncbi:hypothetical protein FACS1894196_4210 [Clostridia bacterium]|nr:hypothetical protein FACS1894196_4210 [Clostridia bacterium]
MSVQFKRGALCLLALCIGCAGFAAPAQATQSDIVIAGYPAPYVPESARVPDSYFADAVLVGDSLATGIPLYDAMPAMKNVYARTGLSPHTAATKEAFLLHNKPSRLRALMVWRKPRVAYLWLGLNGVDGLSAERVLKSYDELLEQLISGLPNTLFYLMEVTPVQAKAASGHKMLNNDNINAFNEGLYALAQAHNIYVLPINAMLRDEDGRLDSDYAAGDGYHLRRKGYQAVVEYLYTHTIPLDAY